MLFSLARWSQLSYYKFCLYPTLTWILSPSQGPQSQLSNMVRPQTSWSSLLDPHRSQESEFDKARKWSFSFGSKRFSSARKRTMSGILKTTHLSSDPWLVWRQHSHFHCSSARSSIHQTLLKYLSVLLKRTSLWTLAISCLMGCSFCISLTLQSKYFHLPYHSLAKALWNLCLGILPVNA